MAALRGPIGSTSKPLADISSAIFFEDDDLTRGKFEHERHEHALRFDFAGAASGEVLFEEDAFVRDVLVDDPKAVAVDAMMKLALTWPSGFRSAI